MESNRQSARFAFPAASSRILSVLFALLMLVVFPASAFAAEGENVVLTFNRSQQILIGVSGGIGLLAVLYGFFRLWGFVKVQSPGDEKMQEVGLAIRDGALAYLRRQIAAMIPLVFVLAIGLFFLYNRLGPAIAGGVGVCFVLGVLASYISGFTGMIVAVAGNMRTANAALTSYRKSLIVAFRSGAVAGMVTVGIGLIGASAIVGLFPTIATNLLVGFAFGASLAALFMRVGGGIFTKAADVGADLVGKVEAGIPEDDPRNPAVIADNVGDNVGDCAGMAADVFESFEVTLIAAIVLGAATASIFDAQTWPRLVVFGLAAAAIGLLASVIGIESVTGNEPGENPLRSLKKGFWVAIGATLIGVLALSASTLSGIQTSKLKPVSIFKNEVVSKLKSIRADLATKTNKEPFEVSVKDLMLDPRVKALGFDKEEDEQAVTGLLVSTVLPEAQLPSLAGYQPLDFSKTNQKVLDYAVERPANPASGPNSSRFGSVNSIFGQTGGEEYIAAHVKIEATLPAQPGGQGVPARAERQVKQDQWIGPLTRANFDAQIKSLRDMTAAQKIKASIDVIETKPVTVYVSPDNRLAIGIDAKVERPWSMQGQIPQTLYHATPGQLETAFRNPESQPQTYPIEIAVVEHTPIAWWKFFTCIAFGILLAFVIEFITDYFVGTSKKPTQETAGVATAGAAPVIIQGFAHSLTSSVYMTLAISAALMYPVILFPPAIYGGYTLSFYGVALVGIGLLTTTGFVLAMDTFGPISDNAQGVFEMSGAGHANPEAARIVGHLDAAGNTTKALTKGFAIATAVVAAVALFHTYLEGAHLNDIGLRLDVPEIFVGLLIGAAAPFLFSAFAIDAVGRASFELIAEVRRQFREDAGIMAGTSRPDYARCVAIVTRAAQKELLAPGVLAIALPIAVGFGFSIGKPETTIGGVSYVLTGAQALGGFLAGAIASGQLLAVLLANSGGMWDNAKKLIEDGLHGGKGTEAHKAAVVADTIGDPFKDTAGPALNPLIKVMNLVAVLVSAVIIQPLSVAVTGGVTAVCLVALVGSIYLAKKGSMSSALQAATSGASEAPAPAIAAAPVAAAEAPSTKKKLFVEEDESES